MTRTARALALLAATGLVLATPVAAHAGKPFEKATHYAGTDSFTEPDFCGIEVQIDVEFNGVGQNIIGSVGDIESENNATATSTATSEAEATGDSAAASEANSTADISQDSSVEISQSNEVGNGFWWGWWWW